MMILDFQRLYIVLYEFDIDIFHVLKARRLYDIWSIVRNMFQYGSMPVKKVAIAPTKIKSPLLYE